MLSFWTVALASVVWLGLMFGTALYGERHATIFARHWRHVYSLSLAVHCTSWTFYGTVTQAARYGWPLPPTFLGAILLLQGAYVLIDGPETTLRMFASAAQVVAAVILIGTGLFLRRRQDV